MKWKSAEVEHSIDYEDQHDNYGVIISHTPVAGRIVINLPLDDDGAAAQFEELIHEIKVKISNQE